MVNDHVAIMPGSCTNQGAQGIFVLVNKVSFCCIGSVFLSLDIGPKVLRSFYPSPPYFGTEDFVQRRGVSDS